ncbi:response regulator [Halorientalis sp.]|uniref:response regulator n=1 Tax=Halorientalis sp. TaxID=1931229 RepID=UPI00262D8891|nr:response regulator [Halorientalis sp.]
MTDGTHQASAAQVLAVEDNPGDVRLLEEGVGAADASLELHVCNNGRLAIERLTGDGGPAPDHPDLVLLDLNLPGKSGLEVLQAIRDDTQFDTVPVIVVSSSENPDDVRGVYEHAANAYVTKPADPDEYIEAVAAAVQFWIPGVTETDD